MLQQQDSYILLFSKLKKSFPSEEIVHSKASPNLIQIEFTKYRAIDLLEIINKVKSCNVTLNTFEAFKHEKGLLLTLIVM